MHNADKDSSHGHGSSKRLPLKMFPKVTWSLLKNLPFLFTMLAGASEGILTSGFATFVPKFIQNRFAVSSSAAALYTGYWISFIFILEPLFKPPSPSFMKKE